MNPSRIFIARPVATTLLTAGILISGVLAFTLLPVAPLPSVDFPTISITAQLPGASPETMAATVATPLERALGEISDVTEMTSVSSLGQARVTLQFDLSRDIDGAARDVQAAINNARNLLPSSLPRNPTYRKVNPADAPILIVALTSDTDTRGQLYDVADSILAQRLSQVRGVGQVTVGGSSQPAVRVEMNPAVLNRYAVSTEDVRAAINSTNANRPKGYVEAGQRHWQVAANDQAKTADEYRPIVVAYRNGAPLRLGDIATVRDSVQDERNAGYANGKTAVLLVITRQPDANIIRTVRQIEALLPQLSASIPRSMSLKVVLDRSPVIRASLHDVERTLLISIGLVILVVFVFLGSARATAIPAVAVPVSLIGTFGIIYLLGFSLNTLSLMALTIATGFVVDDAVVVLENTTRHIEAGMRPLRAALQGAREVSFTVVSMSASLIAAFIPIMAMRDIVGRLFREFIVTLTIAIVVSLIVSLSTTPMMCAYLLPRRGERKLFARGTDTAKRAFESLLRGYERSLVWALDHGRLVMALLLLAVGLNVYLYVIVPKAFFPQQDTGRLQGGIKADQSISFESMRGKLVQFMRIVSTDPAVDSVSGFLGGGQVNSAQVFVSLKPLKVRKASSEEIIDRLRPKLSRIEGALPVLRAVQDIRAGGRNSSSQYQYAIQAESLADLDVWSNKIRIALSKLPQLDDVDSDQQDHGASTYLTIDRDAAARLGLTMANIDAALNNLFGQRQVSVIYNSLNQYRVVMEADRPWTQSPAALKDVYVMGGAVTQIPAGQTPLNQAASQPQAGLALGAAVAAPVLNSQTTRPQLAPVVPLASIAHFEPRSNTLSVNHQGLYPATTLSFGLRPGVSLSQATAAIDEAVANLVLPSSVHASFQGNAKMFREALANQPLLILAALAAIYIVLGVLYESTLHPLTILSTLPSAGVGALLALLATGTELSIVAFIGVVLLIGIVKKNAIMMIDFALVAERAGSTPRAAIIDACVHRFRPILMTTTAALFGALPLALGMGEGSEFRRPLGISIAGGLIVSQLLTLYTTPLVYLYLERAKARSRRPHQRREDLPALAPAEASGP